MDNHVISVSKFVQLHIRALRHIRSSASEDMANMLACALVGSRLDYANSILYTTTQKTSINYRKYVLWLVPISPVSLLQQLHWLPIECRINFKIANTTFRNLYSSQPAYVMPRMLFILRVLSNTNLLSAPFVGIYLAPAASVLQLLKSTTLSLQLSDCAPVPIGLPSDVLSSPILPAGLPIQYP